MEFVLAGLFILLCQTVCLAAGVVLYLIPAQTQGTTQFLKKRKNTRTETEEERKRRILMSNIDSYCGTSLGQREVE